MRGMRMAGAGKGGGGGIFALRRPRPYSRHWRGFRCDASPPTIICAHMGINGNGEWEGNDASLRPPRTGRIGFKPPYSKKRPQRKTRRGAIVYRRHFLTGREVLITQFSLSGTVAMRRAVVKKRRVSLGGGMRGARYAHGGGNGTTFGSQ